MLVLGLAYLHLFHVGAIELKIGSDNPDVAQAAAASDGSSEEVPSHGTGATATEIYDDHTGLLNNAEQGSSKPLKSSLDENAAAIPGPTLVTSADLPTDDPIPQGMFEKNFLPKLNSKSIKFVLKS